MKFDYVNQNGPGSMEIDLDTLEGCPGCGHVPLEYEIENDFIYPAGRTRTLWTAVCTEGGGGGCGWEVLATSPEDALKRWNTRTPKEVIKKHTCQVDTGCSCYQGASEPAEDCAVHGSGTFPPRCATCGKFMRWVC